MDNAAPWEWEPLPDGWPAECPLLRVDARGECSVRGVLEIAPCLDDDGPGALRWVAQSKAFADPVGDRYWLRVLHIEIPPRSRRKALLAAQTDAVLDAALRTLHAEWIIEHDDLLGIVTGRLTTEGLRAFAVASARLSALVAPAFAQALPADRREA